MSASFPCVPGFVGPLSLKTFLEEFFSLRLSFGSKAKLPKEGFESNTISPAHLLQEVTLPVNEAFLVVIYVARHAPAAPPPPPVTHTARQCTLGMSSSGDAHRSKTVPTTFLSKADQWSPPSAKTRTNACSCAAGSAGSAGCRASVALASTSAAPWLLYTEATHRPLTNALLRHPWWSSFASLLRPSGVAFVELYCPVVVQLEAMAGGVQVLGPALHHALPLTSPIKSVMRRWREVKRARDEAADGGQKEHHRLLVDKKRRVEVSASGPVDAHAPSISEKKKAVPRTTQPQSPPEAQTTWRAALLRTDVTRTRLYSVSAEEDTLATSSDAFNIDGPDALPIPASLLEALWLGRHPQSFMCNVRSALPRWRVLQMQRAADSAAPVERGSDAAYSLSLPFCYVKHVFRWMALKPPRCQDVADGASASAADDGNDTRSFDVSGHLQRVLSATLDQCSRLDLRGAALKHLRYIEARFERQQRAKELPDLQRLAAPVDVVVAYLRTLLSTLRWPSSVGVFTADTAGITGASCSFWGIDDTGSFRVLDALLAGVRAWLSAGRQAAFPLSRFLDGVPVAQLPWLRGFFTSPVSKSPSSVRRARQQRSQIQQRVWLQFMLFLTQDVVPFLVRASFTVTWSSKSVNQFLFFPASVWRRVVRCELRRAVRRRATSPDAYSEAKELSREAHLAIPSNGSAAVREENEEVAHEKQGLRQISASSANINQREGTATLTFRNGKASLLYAGVRCRPDGHKLRPIAVLRSASPRSIKEMARGTPRPHSHSASTLRLLMAVLTWAGIAVTPSTTVALAWVQRMQSRREDVFVPRQASRLSPLFKQQPHQRALRDAFRCLVSGVEEQRQQSGLPKLSNLSHQDEYAELRSFCEDVRGRAATRGAKQEREAKGEEVAAQQASLYPGKLGPASLRTTHPCLEPVRVFLVRSDASRCYENLPQAQVLAEAERLVCHDVYRTLFFTAVCGTADAPREGALLLRSVQVSRTLPCADIAAGRVARIPRGHIYWEAESKDGGGKLCTGAASSPPPAGAAVVSGAAVRALLREHLQHHLIALNGSLYEQRIGILQGSPVAMLLCDHLFAKTVDVSLSDILSTHAERSLLLRRVDDVLVATTSAVAAQRCLHAMQRGWPAVGYHSNAQKLTMSAAQGHLVPWCGLLLHDTSLETSVEWRRMGPLLSSLRAADTRVMRCGDREPLLCTQRLLAIVHLRLPPTALCSRINSKARQLQTFYEAALLWSRLLVAKVQETLFAAHHRCVAVLLLRPLAACVARLRRLLRRHHSFLAARQSSCTVCGAEVRACVLTALHRTLQAKLRVLAAKTARQAAAQRQRRRPQQHARDRKGEAKREGVKRAAGHACNREQRRIRRRCPDEASWSSRQSALRSFWWCAASQIESQWRCSLDALEAAALPAPTGVDEAAEAMESPYTATANLLRASGPLSLHMRALQATQPLFCRGTNYAQSSPT